MHVARLSLTDFRNYAGAELTFGPGATVIVGRNGQGKTNLVEAIGYLATLGSHRVSSDQALIRAGADAAIVRAVLAHGGREVLLELQLNRQGANRAQVNRGAAKPRDLPRYVELYRKGMLPVSQLMSDHIRLEQINEGFDRLASGHTVRQIVML